MKKGRSGRPTRSTEQLNEPPAKKIAVDNIVRFSQGEHWPKHSVKKNASRCRAEGCDHKTRFSCIACEVALCPECFQAFHTRPKQCIFVLFVSFFNHFLFFL